MTLTFLGTSAGEEYPGIWCECAYCETARKLGGRNIRRNSCAVIDDDVMIDIGKSAHIQAERFGINLRKIETLLVTHSHNDHFNTHTLWARQMPPGYDLLPQSERQGLVSSRFSPLPMLNMFGSNQVFETLKADGKGFDSERWNLDFTVVEPFRTYTAPGLEFFTLDGNHTDSYENNSRAVNYIITRDGVTFLYLSDSGFPFDATLDAIKRFKYDFIITEGTFGQSTGGTSGHMRLDINLRVLDFFNENRLWKGAPDYYLTHIAPHWTPPHDEYVKIVENHGLKLAYDGLVLEYPAKG